MHPVVAAPDRSGQSSRGDAGVDGHSTPSVDRRMRVIYRDGSTDGVYAALRLSDGS